MIPKAFEYYVANSVDEAADLLRRHGEDAKLLAGGHSLIPAMKLRLATPAVLIDIGRIPELAYIRVEDDGIRIGAGTSHHRLETSAALARLWPALTDAAATIADPQVRNRGTLGGTLAHADPAADMPAVMLALGAELAVRGPEGSRTVNIDDLFLTLFTTTLAPDEILTEIRLPRPAPRTGSAYRKLARKASDFAVVGVAAAVTLDETGACTAARVGITGVADLPYRAAGVEDLLVGRKPDDEALAEAAARAVDDVDVVGDVHASVDYRRHVAVVYTRRVLAAAVERAAAAGDAA